MNYRCYETQRRKGTKAQRRTFKISVDVKALRLCAFASLCSITLARSGRNRFVHTFIDRACSCPPAISGVTPMTMLLVVLFALVSPAQVTTATLYGTVHDVSDAVLPGVSVSVTHQ